MKNKVCAFLLFFLILNVNGQQNNKVVQDSKLDYYKYLKEKRERIMSDGNLTFMLVFCDGTIVPYGELIYYVERDGGRNIKIKDHSESAKINNSSSANKVFRPWKLNRCEGRFNSVFYDNEVDAINASYHKVKTGKCL